MQTPPPLAAGPERPKVLTAAAILCLIFGAFGLFGLVGAVMAGMNVSMPSMPGGSNPYTEMMNEPHVRALSVYGGLIGAAAGAALIAAGIGLLKCRDWARTVAILWAVYSVLASIVAGYITSMYMMPMMEKAMAAQIKVQSHGKGPDVAVFSSKIGAAMGTVTAILGILFALAVAVTLIILVTRPQARAACRAASLGGSGPALS